MRPWANLSPTPSAMLATLPEPTGTTRRRRCRCRPKGEFQRLHRRFRTHGTPRHQISRHVFLWQCQCRRRLRQKLSQQPHCRHPSRRQLQRPPRKSCHLPLHHQRLEMSLSLRSRSQERHKRWHANRDCHHRTLRYPRVQFKHPRGRSRALPGSKSRQKCPSSDPLVLLHWLRHLCELGELGVADAAWASLELQTQLWSQPLWQQHHTRICRRVRLLHPWRRV